MEKGLKENRKIKVCREGRNRRRGAAKEVDNKGKVNSQCWFPDGMLAVTNVAEAAPGASACHASLRPLRTVNLRWCSATGSRWNPRPCKDFAVFCCESDVYAARKGEEEEVVTRSR